MKSLMKKFHDSRLDKQKPIRYNADMRKNKKEKGMQMKIGDFVFAEYDNDEIVNGEVVNVRTFGERVLLTVKAEQGFRSIYLDKCVSCESFSNA